MGDETWSIWRVRVLFVGWAFLGGITVAAFFVAAFFATFSAIQIGDPGAVLLLVPLLIGFLLGVLLTDAEIVVAAAVGVLCASLAVALVAIFLVSPVLAGVVAASRPFAGFSISSTALSMIMLFPLVVVGSVLGRGVGDLFLPSEKLKGQIEALREDTRRWHKSLDRVSRSESSEREADGSGSTERKH